DKRFLTGSIGGKDLIAQSAHGHGQYFVIQCEIAAASSHLDIAENGVLLRDDLMEGVLPDGGIADARQWGGLQWHLSGCPRIDGGAPDARSHADDDRGESRGREFA